MNRLFAFFAASLFCAAAFAARYEIPAGGQTWTTALSPEFLSAYDGVSGGKFIFEFAGNTETVGVFPADFAFDSAVDVRNLSPDEYSTMSNMYHAVFAANGGQTVAFNGGLSLSSKIKTRLDFRSDNLAAAANFAVRGNIEISGGVSQADAELWLYNANFTYQPAGGIGKCGYTHFFHGATLVAKDSEIAIEYIAIRTSQKFENGERLRGCVVADDAVVVVRGLINQQPESGVFKFRFENGGAFCFEQNLSVLFSEADGSRVAFENMSDGDVIKAPESLSGGVYSGGLTVNGASVDSLLASGALVQTQQGGLFVYTYSAAADGGRLFYNISGEKIWTSALPSYFTDQYLGFSGDTFYFRFGGATENVGVFGSDFIFDTPVVVENTTSVSSMYHARFVINNGASVQFNKAFLLKSDVKTRLDFRSEGAQDFGTAVLRRGVEFSGAITQDLCEFWLHRVNFVYNAEGAAVNMGYTHFENAPSVVVRDCRLTMTTLAIRNSTVKISGTQYALGSACVDGGTFTVKNMLNQNSLSGEFKFAFMRGGAFVFERSLALLTANGVVARFEGMSKGDSITVPDSLADGAYAGRITINGAPVASLLESGALVLSREGGAYVYTFTLEADTLALSSSAESALAGNTLEFEAFSDNPARTYILLRNGAVCAVNTSGKFAFVENVAGENSYAVKAVYNDNSTALSGAVAVKVGIIRRFYVSTSGSDSADGGSWQSAFLSVARGIAAAAETATDALPTEVWIAAGTYACGAPMSLAAGVRLYGGFAGTESALSERAIGGAETVITAGGAHRIFENVFYAAAALTDSTVLDSLTFSGGYAQDNGGAIYNFYASPKISNCKFVNNAARLDGGALFNEYSSPAITGCVFENNSASCGGAIGGYTSGSRISDCVFSGNAARSGGGAIFNDRSATVIFGCKFSGNSAVFGGAVYSESSPAEFENSQMDGNAADFGGAVYNNSSRGVITNTTFFENAASLDGGALYCELSSTPAISNMTAVGNSAGRDGGALCMNFSATRITMNNCTVADNSASVSGGGAAVKNAAYLAARNGIFWGNLSADSLQISEINVLERPSVENCIVQGGFEGGVSIIDENPALLPLADNGGAVQTAALAPSSPAIGKCAASTSPASTDARCYVRVLPACLGACEYLPIAIASQPGDLTAFRGEAAALSISVESDFARLQWQVSTDGGQSWSDVESAVSPTLDLAEMGIADGSYLYRCKVSQPQRDTAYSSAAKVSMLADTKYNRWAVENALKGGDAAEAPLGDGITNLERFVFGFPAGAPSAYAQNAMFAPFGGTGSAGIVFPVRKSATDVSVEVLKSSDMQNWTPAECVKTGESGDFFLYRAEEPIPGDGKIFFKINVSQQ